MAKSNNTFGKIAYWIVAIIVILVFGMIFPGVAHTALCIGAIALYRENFKD